MCTKIKNWHKTLAQLLVMSNRLIKWSYKIGYKYCLDVL